MPAFTTSQFQRFFDLGWAVHCVLPTGGGIGKGRAHPNPFPAKRDLGWALGHWVDLKACWAMAHGRQPCVTCKRSWESLGGTRRISLLFAHLLLLLLSIVMLMGRDGSSLTSLSSKTLDLVRWAMNSSQPSSGTLLWPACRLADVDKSRSSMSAEILRIWDIHDRHLQFTRVDDLDAVRDALVVGDVFFAWLTWSKAAKSELAGAYTETGGVGLKTGRVGRKMRSVALGGPKVRKSCSNFTDPTDGRNVRFFRDCSVSPILNQRRRKKAVLDVHDCIGKRMVFLLPGLWSLGLTGTKSSPKVWFVSSSLMILFSGTEMGTSGLSRNTSPVFLIGLESSYIRLHLGVEML